MNDVVTTQVFVSNVWYDSNTLYPNESRFILITMRNAYSFSNIADEIKLLTKMITQLKLKEKNIRILRVYVSQIWAHINPEIDLRLLFKTFSLLLPEISRVQFNFKNKLIIWTVCIFELNP